MRAEEPGESDKSRREGRLGDALRVLDRVVGTTADYARAWLERGFAFDDGGSLRPAAESYARAAALDPRSGPAFAGGALIAARTGDLLLAADLAARALALDPLDAVATRAAATAEIESGAPLTASSANPKRWRDITMPSCVRPNGRSTRFRSPR